MSIGRVVRHFEASGKLPVDILEVLEQVRSHVPDERIRLKSVNVDPTRLRGGCWRYRYKIDDGSILMPIQCSTIVYSAQMDLRWQRLVACKELIHVLDPDPITTSKMEDVVHLAETLASATGPVRPAANNLQTFFDQLAKWQATTILFPFGFREEILPYVADGRVDVATLSEWTQLPTECVQVVLSDAWEPLREVVLAFGY